MRTWIFVSLWVAGATVAAACGGNDTSTSASTSGSAGNANSGGDSNTGGAANGGGGGAANGGNGQTGGGGQGGGNAGGTSSGGAGQGGSGGSSGFCPDAPPAQNDTCDAPGKWCSWGADERYGCRIASLCMDNHKWDRYPASGGQGCPAPMPACPTAGFDGDCTMADLGLTCVDSTDTAYTCTNCSGSLCVQGQTWQQTSGTTLDPNCPTDKLPNLGDACTHETLTCDYNLCADDQDMFHQWAHGVGLICTNGHWTIWNSMMFCI